MSNKQENSLPSGMSALIHSAIDEDLTYLKCQNAKKIRAAWG